MLGIFFRSKCGIERHAAVLIEFTEKFYVLKSGGMNEGSKHVDREVKQVSYDEDKHEYYKSDDRRSHHSTEYIDNLRDNARRKSQREYTRVGQEVGGVVDKIVKSEKSFSQLTEDILLFSSHKA